MRLFRTPYDTLIGFSELGTLCNNVNLEKHYLLIALLTVHVCKFLIETMQVPVLEDANSHPSIHVYLHKIIYMLIKA